MAWRSDLLPLSERAQVCVGKPLKRPTSDKRRGASDHAMSLWALLESIKVSAEAFFFFEMWGIV